MALMPYDICNVLKKASFRAVFLLVAYNRHLFFGEIHSKYFMGHNGFHKENFNNHQTDVELNDP